MAGILRTVETFSDTDTEVHKDPLGYYKYETYNLPMIICLVTFAIFIIFVYVKFKM